MKLMLLFAFFGYVFGDAYLNATQESLSNDTMVNGTAADMAVTKDDEVAKGQDDSRWVLLTVLAVMATFMTAMLCKTLCTLLKKLSDWRAERCADTLIRSQWIELKKSEEEYSKTQPVATEIWATD